MYAVIRTGGKQYVVTADQTITIEKLDQAVGKAFAFADVLMIGDSEAKLGAPIVSGAKVEATVVAHGRAPKVVGVKFHNKVRYHRKFGHRQDWTKVKITKVSA